MHRLEEGHEPLLLDEQDGAVAVVGSAGREDRQLRQLHLQLRQRVLSDRAQVPAHLERAQRHDAPGVRLVEMATGVEHDVPLGRRARMLVHEVGQELLREVLIVERAAGQALDLAACGVHDLAGVRRQRAAAARLEVGLRHHAPRRLADRHPSGADKGIPPARDARASRSSALRWRAQRR